MRFYPESISLREHYLVNLQTKHLIIGNFVRFYCLFNFSDDLK